MYAFIFTITMLLTVICFMTICHLNLLVDAFYVFRITEGLK